VRARLITIGPSHYCEKARWALDYAGIGFDEDAHLPIVHRFYTRRYGTSVPVLVNAEQTFPDSTEILRLASETAPAPLYDAQGQALLLEEHFDETLGPAVRRLAYCYLAREPELFRRVFAPYATGYEQRVLALGYKALAKAMGKLFRVSDRAAERSFETVLRVYDEVASKLGSNAYLVGGSFSAADLTFSALSHPLLAFASEIRKPGTWPSTQDLPRAFRTNVEELMGHPAGLHALRMYAQHR
jgi:glutathione S-transferase